MVKEEEQQENYINFTCTCWNYRVTHQSTRTKTKLFCWWWNMNCPCTITTTTTIYPGYTCQDRGGQLRHIIMLNGLFLPLLLLLVTVIIGHIPTALITLCGVVGWWAGWPCTSGGSRPPPQNTPWQFNELFISVVRTTEEDVCSLIAVYWRSGRVGGCYKKDSRKGVIIFN